MERFRQLVGQLAGEVFSRKRSKNFTSPDQTQAAVEVQTISGQAVLAELEKGSELQPGTVIVIDLRHHPEKADRLGLPQGVFILVKLDEGDQPSSALLNELVPIIFGQVTALFAAELPSSGTTIALDAEQTVDPGKVLNISSYNWISAMSLWFLKVEHLDQDVAQLEVVKSIQQKTHRVHIFKQK